MNGKKFREESESAFVRNNLKEIIVCTTVLKYHCQLSERLVLKNSYEVEVSVSAPSFMLEDWFQLEQRETPGSSAAQTCLCFLHHRKHSGTSKYAFCVTLWLFSPFPDLIDHGTSASYKWKIKREITVKSLLKLERPQD